jgi:ribosomal-protein-alanine N-acetyltransferase
VDILTTERLVLRPQRADDAPFVLALMNDPDWIRYIGDRGVRTVEDARRYILDGAVRMYAEHGLGLYLVEAAGEPVGLCGLIHRDFLPDPDLGFAFAAAHRRRGYAREASEAVLAAAPARVAAIVTADNEASIALLVSLGFTHQGPFEYPGGDTVQLYSRTSA